MFQSAKRLFDIVVSLTALFVLFPIFIALMMVIRAQLGSPIFFNQFRAGIHGESFRLIKFRTMTDDRDGNGCLLSDSQRLGKLGIFLRSTSLDELPELWNVLKGDMSVVGPRPLLVEYLPLYSAEQARRHTVRPGITGLAQIMGRNSLSWEEKFEYDIQYVDNASFVLDLKILFVTVKKVITREGITPNGEVAVPKFTGNREL